MGDNNISLANIEQAQSKAVDLSTAFQLNFPSNQVSTFNFPPPPRNFSSLCRLAALESKLRSANLISFLSWISILAAVSVFTISLKNYISFKLAALPFPIIIGESPSGSRNVSNLLQTDCGPAALRL
ncbi:MAG: hypothetical protein ACTS80_00875, partial [Candidatus Hodgkinia cicadicola]